jgi:Family of unknown function (DUF6186)
VSTSTISYVVWALLGAATVLLWALSYVRPGSVAHPGAAVAQLTTRPVVRILFVLGFMWLGWHMFAR